MFRNEPDRCVSKKYRLRCELRQGHLAPHENDGVRWTDLATHDVDVDTGGRL